MAYIDGNLLMAGSVGVLQPVSETGVIKNTGVGGAGGIMPGGMAGGPAPTRPGQVTAADPWRRAALAGWSADGTLVSWVTDGGRLATYRISDGTVLRTTVTAGEAALVTGTDRAVAVRSRPQTKLEAAGSRPAPDLTSVELIDPANPGANRVLIPPGAADWHDPVVSPDGKRLAVVSNRGHEAAHPGRWRVWVLDLPGGEPKAVSPAAEQVEGLCWAPEGKSLLYARSQEPPPPDHLPGRRRGAFASCDLFELDPATGQETRLSRGGGFASPSVTLKDGPKDCDLCFLMEGHHEGGDVTVSLLRMSLQAAREFAREHTPDAARTAKQWSELATRLLQEAGVRADADGASLTPESLKKLGDAFARIYADHFKSDQPTTAAGLDAQRREAQRLDLPAREQAALVLVLGAVEGEYLRRRPEGTRWSLGKGPLQTAESAALAENLFGCAFNPFRPLRAEKKPAGPQSLAEALYRAAGRPLVLSNDPKAANEALDRLVDPDLARGTELLAQKKGEQADALLLALLKRHERNARLALHVGELLYAHGHTAALASWGDQAKPGDLLPRDARSYNLLGVALLPAQAHEAVAAFRKALACDLKYGPAYLNLAEAYQRLGQPQEARMCLRRYLKLMPDGELAADARQRLARADDAPEAGGADPMAPR
jgi:tetratricopeptide (TPR) repeat protein